MDKGEGVPRAHTGLPICNYIVTQTRIVSDIAIFVLKRDVKLQLTQTRKWANA